MEQFPQFDVVSDFSDHKFISTATSYLPRAATRAVMKEWKILEKNLPAGSVFVRAYDSRVDLLRAAIVGPQKTPYHDGLFFFDFQFPPNYPDAPPKAHYWSFGRYLNPNLYENGLVCLSLLNTWRGPKETRWQPGVSTMLQVLVSIQALVLNHAPLHNEPMLLVKLWTTSSTYNDAAFVLSCRTMLSLLRRPPRGFGRLLEHHFRARAHAILTACQVYLNGFARVGDYEYDERRRRRAPRLFASEEEEQQRRVSVNSDFKRLLKIEYKALVIAFSKYDPSLKGFSDELERMVDDAVKSSIPPGIFCSLSLLFRKCWEWMVGWRACNVGASVMEIWRFKAVPYVKLKSTVKPFH
ncbi:PREDICTED: putative ubiquitin-conjugating enzyme E2 38 [Ipomoea nil]|uniref:putative ubiquitin-conjugating enzyme E2 38 n=1 Tax=Ipomoea nil TaxID=35883 RepID=UPI000901C14D|nr:PREDICTED: putative ubiquitin-conjugating enzyme E2 38 [Ipomoea nil]